MLLTSTKELVAGIDDLIAEVLLCATELIRMKPLPTARDRLVDHLHRDRWASLRVFHESLESRLLAIGGEFLDLSFTTIRLPSLPGISEFRGVEFLGNR